MNFSMTQDLHIALCCTFPCSGNPGPVLKVSSLWASDACSQSVVGEARHRLVSRLHSPWRLLRLLTACLLVGQWVDLGQAARRALPRRCTVSLRRNKNPGGRSIKLLDLLPEGSRSFSISDKYLWSSTCFLFIILKKNVY